MEMNISGIKCNIKSVPKLSRSKNAVSAKSQTNEQEHQNKKSFWITVFLVRVLDKFNAKIAWIDLVVSPLKVAPSCSNALHPPFRQCVQR